MRLKRFLNKPPLDWVKIYTELQAFGVSDPIFFRDSFFTRVPIEIILEQYASCILLSKRTANSFSYTAATIARGLHGAKQGSIKIADFLPFSFVDDGKKLDADTAHLVRDLIKKGEIPLEIVSGLSPIMDQIITLTSD